MKPNLALLTALLLAPMAALHAVVARHLGVSRSRVTQMLNLLTDFSDGKVRSA